MQNGRLQEHADSFQSGAAQYDRQRPSYPPASVDWLRGSASGPLDVLDLGAGTGKLSAMLLERGDRVIAVDPSADMLRVASEQLPQLRTLIGAGENIPLSNASVDLVTVAQAWHWMDESATTREILRVLRPGGRLGLIWNSRDESIPWVAALGNAMHFGALETPFVPTVGAGMTIDARREERWTQRTTRSAIRQLATTRSYYLVADEHEQRAMLERIDAVLDNYAETRSSEILLPYVTQCWLASAWTGESA